MPTKLKQLKLDELSLVDNPANKMARVTIFKCSEEKEHDDMPAENITKKEHDDAVAALNKAHKDALDAINDRVAKLTADLEVEKAKAKMTDEEREHMEEMEDEDKKKKFLALPPAERKKAMGVKKASDESVEINGVKLFKSKVGDATFEVLKAQEKRIKDSEEAILKHADEAETARIEKRVDAEFKNVVGKTEEKAKVLKYLAKAPDDVRKTFEAIMKAAEAMTLKSFETLGHLNGRASLRKGEKPFLDRITEVQKRDKVSRVVAMDKAREEFPEEFEQYQNAAEAMGN